ncbi:MAG: 16S rRNA methyltransferase [Thermoprotei archaeon]|nr:MAG: 16S rRNA methyltransferase [Thermoprotei archaeon]
MRTTGTEPLFLILADAALELVPEGIRGHPEVVAYARRRGRDPSRVLLDKSFHFHAMSVLRDKHKRGRPDIAHFFLLEALSSPLNRAGLLRIYLHTYTGEVIEVEPSTRIPRNYLRFVGLMEQLLSTGRVPPAGPNALMKVVTRGFRNLVEMLSPDMVVLLDENGFFTRLRVLADNLARLMRAGLRVAVVIGGFPHGSFSSEVLRSVSTAVSLYRSVLETWTVTSRLLAAIELSLGLL